jgi:hypothetical protein
MIAGRAAHGRNQGKRFPRDLNMAMADKQRKRADQSQPKPHHYETERVPQNLSEHVRRRGA